MNRIRRFLFLCALAATIGLPNVGQSQVGQSQLANPDMASEKELLALPHMTAALAKSIMEQRPFLNMADLHALLSKTLSKEQLAELYGKMFVQINLNTAAPSEILLIPGVGNRMLREFKSTARIKRSRSSAGRLASTSIKRKWRASNSRSSY